MARWSVTRNISAPIGTVFSAVANVDQFTRVRPQVLRIEFQSDIHSGVGTRFRETRRMKDTESTNDLEITEYEPERRVRFVTESNGTVWDSTYTVEERSGSSVLTLTMDAISRRWLPRIMVLLISGVLQKALEGDMDIVKEFCERETRSRT